MHANRDLVTGFVKNTLRCKHKVRAQLPWPARITLHQQSPTLAASSCTLHANLAQSLLQTSGQALRIANKLPHTSFPSCHNDWIEDKLALFLEPHIVQHCSPMLHLQLQRTCTLPVVAKTWSPASIHAIHATTSFIFTSPLGYKSHAKRSTEGWRRKGVLEKKKKV